MSETNTNSTVEVFYDNFGHKLILDYLQGNLRTKDAIAHALQWIPESAEKILDIGCGIGWSSYEIAKHYPDKKVVAVDISHELLDLAKTVFPHRNVEYSKVDATSEEFIKKDQFGAVILLDVYEHIPVKSRKDFHQSIDKLLQGQGIVILTCPSIHHQKWLQEHNPKGLQPVDEIVTIRELEDFAQAIQGEVISFQYKSVWHQHDYFHAVLHKQPDFFYEPLQHNQKSRIITLDSVEERVKRIKNSRISSHFDKEIKALDKSRDRNVKQIIKQFVKK